MHIWVLYNKTTKAIKAVWQAPHHPLMRESMLPPLHPSDPDDDVRRIDMTLFELFQIISEAEKNGEAPSQYILENYELDPTPHHDPRWAKIKRKPSQPEETGRA